MIKTTIGTSPKVEDKDRLEHIESSQMPILALTFHNSYTQTIIIQFKVQFLFGKV